MWFENVLEYLLLHNVPYSGVVVTGNFSFEKVKYSESFRVILDDACLVFWGKPRVSELRDMIHLYENGFSGFIEFDKNGVINMTDYERIVINKTIHKFTTEFYNDTIHYFDGKFFIDKYNDMKPPKYLILYKRLLEKVNERYPLDKDIELFFHFENLGVKGSYEETIIISDCELSGEYCVPQGIPFTFYNVDSIVNFFKYYDEVSTRMTYLDMMKRGFNPVYVGENLLTQSGLFDKYDIHKSGNDFGIVSLGSERNSLDYTIISDMLSVFGVNYSHIVVDYKNNLYSVRLYRDDTDVEDVILGSFDNGVYYYFTEYYVPELFRTIVSLFKHKW